MKLLKKNLIIPVATVLTLTSCTIETKPVDQEEAEANTENAEPDRRDLADSPNGPKKRRQSEDPDRPQKENNEVENPEVDPYPYKKERSSFVSIANTKRSNANQGKYKEISYYHEFAQKLADLVGPAAIWPEGESFQSHVARQRAASEAMNNMKYEETMYKVHGEKIKGLNVYTQGRTSVTLENFSGGAAALAQAAYQKATTGFLNPSTGIFSGDTIGVGIHCATEVWRNTKKRYCTFVVISGNATSEHNIPGLTPVPVAPEEICPKIPASLGTGDYSVAPWLVTYYDDDEARDYEYVSKPTINYIYDELHGIDSKNFRAVWESEVNVENQDQLIEFAYNLSWASLKIYINDVEVHKAQDSAKPFQHLFKVGKSKVRVELENNWHTTLFNLTLKQNREFEYCQVSALLKDTLKDNYKILYLGTYESDERYNQIKVTLAERKDPVVLVLSSYNPVNYVIENPHQVQIAAVLYSSFAKGSFITDDSIPSYEVERLRYNDESRSESRQQITEILGRPQDEHTSKYNLYNVTL